MKKLLVMLACLALLMAASPVKEGYEVGDIASDFNLKNVDGRMVSLENFVKAKGFIVVFDCNTCPYSKKYNSRINALSKKYEPKDFPLVAINSNDPEQSPGDSFDEMVKYAKAKDYAFPYLFDETQSVAKAFGATNTPHVFVLSKQGNRLQVAYIGTIDDNPRDEAGVKVRYVEDAVEALLAGKEVPKTKTKAIGCGIKWKDS
jgi:peroxiredoxin